MATISEAFAIAVGHHEAGRLAAAEQIYRQIVAADPSHAAAHYNLANALQVQGQLDAAIECYQRTIALTPQHAEAHSNLGAAFQALGQLPAAIDCYRSAAQLQPGSAVTHYNLGTALQDQGKLGEATASLHRALELKPDFAEAYNRLGNAWQAQGKLAEASACYHRAWEIRPDYAEALNNLGGALQSQGRPDDALVCYQHALAINPTLAEVHNSLGTLLFAEGKIAEASHCYRTALQFRPDYPEAHYNQSLITLQRGDFERGWPEYEWRWKCQEFKVGALRRRAWDGSPVAGSVLLHVDQGAGDTLQFLRYAPLVKERAGQVLLRCPGRLIPLLGVVRGIDRFISQDVSPPDCEAEIHLSSLPLVFHTTLESIPKSVPYVFADPQLIEAWRRRLPAGGFNVGIAWQGSPSYRIDFNRSIPLPEFAPLAQVAGLRLISLQKQHGLEQLAAVKGQFEVLELPPDVDESSGAFMDTAAIMMNLDLVVTSDTSIAHLAGALGVPVWVALSFVPEWRWLLDRGDSPWYPTVRLFRQASPGDWSSIFQPMSAELRDRIAGSIPPQNVSHGIDH